MALFTIGNQGKRVTVDTGVTINNSRVSASGEISGNSGLKLRRRVPRRKGETPEGVERNHNVAS